MAIVCAVDHYGDNDPLNKTDPLGLRPRDGTCTSYSHDFTALFDGTSSSLETASGTEYERAAERFVRAEELSRMHWARRWFVANETVRGARLSGHTHRALGNAAKAGAKGVGGAGIVVGAYFAVENIAHGSYNPKLWMHDRLKGATYPPV